MEDEEIVKLYLDREERAIRATQEKYGWKLEQMSERIVGDRETAGECVNDTYLRTWEAIPPHEPWGYFFAFVARIARGISLNRYKKEHAKKRQATVVTLTAELQECVAGGGTVEQNIDEKLLKESLNEFVAGLQEEKRMIFIRRYWYMDEISVIAKEMGYSVAKVKGMLFRLRKKLKDRLEKDGFF